MKKLFLGLFCLVTSFAYADGIVCKDKYEEHTRITIKCEVDTLPGVADEERKVHLTWDMPIDLEYSENCDGSLDIWAAPKKEPYVLSCVAVITKGNDAFAGLKIFKKSFLVVEKGEPNPNPPIPPTPNPTPTPPAPPPIVGCDSKTNPAFDGLAKKVCIWSSQITNSGTQRKELAKVYRTAAEGLDKSLKGFVTVPEAGEYLRNERIRILGANNKEWEPFMNSYLAEFEKHKNSITRSSLIQFYLATAEGLE